MPGQKNITFNGKEWIDVENPSRAEMDALSKKYYLNEHLVKDCMEPDHLPKYDFVDDVHFLILRFYAPEFEQDNATIQELTNKIAIFFTDQFVITIHKSTTGFINGIKDKFVKSAMCTNVAALIIRIAWLALETFDDPSNKLSDEIDDYEKKLVVHHSASTQMKQLYDIKRQLSISQRIIMMMLEPINHIPVSKNDKAAYQDLKDQHLKLQSQYNQCLEDVTNLLNLSLSMSSHKTNEVVKVLTLFSVFFMPLTFIVGVYGMNFTFMPELSKKWGYPAVLGLMVVVSIVIYVWFKRKRWL